MKIVHVATSLNGGAGIAAKRIAQAQFEFGVDVSLVAGNGDARSLKDFEQIAPMRALTRIQSKALTVLQSKVIQRDSRLVTSLSISAKLLPIKEIRDADIVHFHAFYNFFSVHEIISLSKFKNIVVTLHDERFFTGGCHYSFDCQFFQSDCSSCPQVRGIFDQLPKRQLDNSKQEMLNAKSIHFVSPSKWLAARAQKSKLLNHLGVSVIPNPVPNTFALNKHTKPSDYQITLGFISENLNNPYKGLKLLIEAIQKIEKPGKFKLLLFGTGKIPVNSKNIDISVRHFSGDSESIEAYQSCDLIVVPSFQDNSPSVVSEALMCGVPVIGSDAGGIPEMIEPYGMKVFKAGNLESLLLALSANLEKSISDSAQAQIFKHFSYESSVRAHVDLYESIINRM